MSKLVKIIITVVLVLVAGVAAYIFLLNPQQPAEAQEKQMYSYEPGDYFVTNIKDSTRLLKTTIVLAVDDPNKTEYMDEHKQIIRDIIISTLREKTEDELRSMDIQDKLRVEIVNNIRAKLDMNYLVTLYFNDLVLQ
ncbi:MAG: flagellar basal body-associated FliL family protein [Christensenellales bacterium]|nr:flagellar basal body-associated FliL family protein [Clostridiales bacterium]